jgi:DNA mismatch repair protein MutL
VHRIHLLSDHLVSQIAAGEVVERPASVVKELVENALDSGATEVRVELEGGGRSRIAVADDGCGMGRDDALLAFDRHATSKIGSFADLERVATLGFRGEALASIAAVARVDLATAEAPGDGTRVVLEGGRVLAAEPAARPRGTTVEVRSLFFNVPARRKFLKTYETELRRSLEVVQGYALARPEVRFTVAHEQRTLLDAPASGHPEGDPRATRERIGQIFGHDFAARLAEIPAAADESGPDASLSIAGFLGDAKTARSYRQLTFVNRRLLRDRAILATFYRAVREVWRSEDFPALFLFLDLPPEEVDVNVHPQKSEVRFRDPRLLDRLSRALVRGLDRVRGEAPAPLRAPAAPAPPDAYVPFAWQGLGEPTPAAWRRSANAGQPVEVREPEPVYGDPESPGREPQPFAGDRKAAGGEPEPGAGKLEPAGQEPELVDGREEPAHREPGSPPAAAGNPVRGSAEPGQRRLPAPVYRPPAARAPVPLSGRRGEVRPFRLLGQYKGTLLLLEGADGLYLIDQHVAHERILYERLRRALDAERTPVQTLLTPPLLELAPAERLRLEELAPALDACGFRLEPLSGNALALTAVPAVLSTSDAEALLAKLAGDREGGDGAAADLRRRILDALAASLACKAAVKMHHPLAPLEMEALVAELFAAEQPYACPHGRPIVLQMTDADLERRFGRR